MALLLKVICNFNAIPQKILTGIFLGLNKLILKFLQNNKWLRYPENFKKNKSGMAIIKISRFADDPGRKPARASPKTLATVELRTLANKGTCSPPWYAAVAQASGGQPRERTGQPTSPEIFTMLALRALGN